jgi:RND superfamily putative drug exporter
MASPKSGSNGGSGGDARGIAGRAAHWSAEHRKTAILGWLGFVVIAVMLGTSIGQNQISSVDRYSGEAHEAEKALDGAGLRPNSEVVFVQSEMLTVEDAEFSAAIGQVTRRLAQVQYVENVKSPLAGGGAVTSDRHAALVEFEIAGDSTEAAERVDPSLEAVAAVAARHPDLVVEQFGDASANGAVQDTIGDDLKKAGELSIPVTLVILLIAFGAMAAAAVPLLLGITAVIAAISLVAIPSQLFPVDENIAAVILLIGLAVGVDYSLFYLRREREERAAGRDARSSLEVAAATSGRAVLISGLTVMVAMAGMFLSGDKTFFSFAEGTILVVAIAMFASLTVLPATLAWLGDGVEKGRVPFLGSRWRRAGMSRFWTAVIDRVTRRPVLSIVLAGGALVALSIPALSLKTVESGVEDLPQDLAVVETYNRVKDAFPAEGVTASVAVEADDVRSGEAAAGIAALVRRVRTSDVDLPGTEVRYSSDDGVAEIKIPTRGTGTDSASTNALYEIRDEIIPATIGQVDGTTVNVSGDAAASEDFRTLLNDRLPLIFAFVFAFAFLLMLLTFRSIVIPIKAILLNLLSVGAAYGVLVLVFQDGHGESLLGFTSNGGVTSWLPLFLFVILFGLSMDYHVFILSRVREAHEGGMSTTDAVRYAISATAGTVTSAALVMVAVFSVFITLSFIDFKAMGLGLATAVLIDATIIRGVLLPASMKLLGDWNWYLPKWLEWLPRVGSAPGIPPPPEAELSKEGGTEKPAPASTPA